MDAALLSAYGRPVPRYTSNPTAAQFGTAVGPVQHAAWLADLAGTSAALYLHVPFCRQLCWYCACHTMAMRSESTLDAYADALSWEVLKVAQTAPGLAIDAIQWGGGTPGQIGRARLRRIGLRVATLFDRRPQAEIAFEVDPRYCGPELATAVAELGVTRVSLGVQDFDPLVQRAINRIQSLDDTAGVIDRLRAAGIRRLNIDLVYGLPHQTLDSLAKTIGQALQFTPDRFAVFGYAHVPRMKPHQRLIDTAVLPGLPLRAEMADLVANRLTAAGYVRVGLDHYAVPEDSLAVAMANSSLQRNFQGYVADGSRWVVGVGASAISSLPLGFSQNVVNTRHYISAAIKDEFATARGVALTSDDRLRGEIIQQLMCRNHVDLAECCRRFGIDPETFAAGIEQLPSLEKHGLIEGEGLRLAVTEKGRPLVRFVCAAFDRYYRAGAGRHASGI